MHIYSLSPSAVYGEGQDQDYYVVVGTRFQLDLHGKINTLSINMLK